MDACDAIYGFVLDIVDAYIRVCGCARVQVCVKGAMDGVLDGVLYVQCSIIRFYGWACVMKIVYCFCQGRWHFSVYTGTVSTR